MIQFKQVHKLNMVIEILDSTTSLDLAITKPNVIIKTN